MKRIFVYKLEAERAPVDKSSIAALEVRTWSPGLTRWIPPNSPPGYFLLWLAHYFGVFDKGDYRAFEVFSDHQPVCSLVCVPALARWSFMKAGDLQIKNVYTHPDFRGKGYASKLIKYVLARVIQDSRVVWYMTDEHNIPSQRLCEKVGFTFVGEYMRRREKIFFYKGAIMGPFDH